MSDTHNQTPNIPFPHPCTSDRVLDAMKIGIKTRTLATLLTITVVALIIVTAVLMTLGKRHLLHAEGLRFHSEAQTVSSKISLTVIGGGKKAIFQLPGEY